MHYLTTSTGAQTISFIPRRSGGAPAYVDVIDEAEGTTASNSTGYTIDAWSYKHQLAQIYSLVEGRFYVLKIYDDPGKTEDDLIYYSRIYCTDQALSDFDFDNSEFTEKTTTNEYQEYNG